MCFDLTRCSFRPVLARRPRPGPCQFAAKSVRNASQNFRIVDAAALASLSAMHAFFWKDSNFWTRQKGKAGGGGGGDGGDGTCAGAGDGADANDANDDVGVSAELAAAVWPSGMYTQPSMQPAEQMETVAEHWAVHLDRFADLFASAPECGGSSARPKLRSGVALGKLP